MWNGFLSIMVTSLIWIYNLVGQNFGWAIIIFTVLIRFLTYPLTARQMKSSKAMQELQNSKEWQDIQKKYKNDKETLAQKQMQVYQEKGISPFSSCLPLLVQFPIIIGLYQSITRALAVSPIQLVNLSKLVDDGASLVPINSTFLWMTDLSQPERWTPDILGFGIPVLAILVLITSYVQSKMISPPPATGDNSQAAQMTQSMTIMMPIMMGWLTLTLNAGLGLYFVATNLATILQYVIMGNADFSNILPRLPSLTQRG